MRTVRLLGLIVVTVCAAGPLPAAVVSIDANTCYQTIEGWGSSMITYSLGSTPYANQRWREAYRDLGCNILRMPMGKEVLVDGSGDMRIPVVLSDNLQSNSAKMNFNLSSVTVLGNMAAWLRTNALEPERVRIVGSLWTPPHWMKGMTGHKVGYVANPSLTNFSPWLSNGRNGDSIGGRLLQDPNNLTQFGRYIAAWLKGFEQRFSTPVYAVSLQNEVSFENPFDSCTYEAGEGSSNTVGAASQWWQYAGALKAVKDAFAQFGIGTKIKGPHCAGIKESPANPWELNQQMKYIEAVKLHSDTGLINALNFYASNGYIGSSSNAVLMLEAYWKGRASVSAPWAFWLYAPGVQHDGKPTWFSECGGELAPWLNGGGGTPGTGAIVLALKMHNALVHGNVSAYIHWQMSDTSNNETEHILLGKNNVNNPQNSKKYCAYKHFSRYIRPGAIRVNATFENGRTSINGANPYDTYNSLNVSTFIHTQDLTVTIVLVNMRAGAENVTINTPASAMPVPSYQVYRSSSSENFVRQSDLVPNADQLMLTVPGYSVVTVFGQVPEPAWVAALALLWLTRRR